MCALALAVSCHDDTERSHPSDTVIVFVAESFASPPYLRLPGETCVTFLLWGQMLCTSC